MLSSKILTESLMSSGVKFLNTLIITFAPAFSKALALSYSQFVPGNTGMKILGLAKEVGTLAMLVAV